MKKAIFFATLLSATMLAQTPPPGAIHLLPGYEHTPATGKKSGKAGVLQRTNGPRIEYEFGWSPDGPIPAPIAVHPAATPADDPDVPETVHPASAVPASNVPAPQSPETINEVTSIAGRPARFIGTPGKGGTKAEVYFTRDKLGFRANYVNTQQLAEILLTTLSYPARPDQPAFLRIPFRRIKLEKDPANTLITHGRVTHTVGAGSSGTITQPGEPDITYSVGAQPAAMPQWSLQQDFIGHHVIASYGSSPGQKAPTLQIVFLPNPGSDADPVTFRSRIHNDREFVHVMMTVLTYHQ